MPGDALGAEQTAQLKRSESEKEQATLYMTPTVLATLDGCDELPLETLIVAGKLMFSGASARWSVGCE